MKLNTLKEQLKKWQTYAQKLSVGSAASPVKVSSERLGATTAYSVVALRAKKTLVVGGEISWKPVNKTAALVAAKAPWWAFLNETRTTETSRAQSDALRTQKTKTPRKKKEKDMKGAIAESTVRDFREDIPTNGEYTSRKGLRIKMVNGEPLFYAEDLNRVLAEEIAKLPQETRPNVLAAQDARKIIEELLHGIGGEMEKFKANTKVYLDDIRQTRFAVVRETADIMGPLKDIRQFFLGPDYAEQIQRLREFVDLCERLQKLKDSGFLDSVADTLIRLS